MKKGIQTKTQILEAAMAILGREGIEGLSASALAREVGISKATLFHYFASIEEIPLVAFEHLWIESMKRERPALPLREYLSALGREVLDMAREQRPFLNAYFVFFSQAIFKPALREKLLASTNVLHDAMVAALTEKRSPALSPREIESTACLIEMALDGMGLHLLVLRQEDELARAWSRFVDLIAPVALDV